MTKPAISMIVIVSLMGASTSFANPSRTSPSRSGIAAARQVAEPLASRRGPARTGQMSVRKRAATTSLLRRSHRQQAATARAEAVNRRLFNLAPVASALFTGVAVAGDAPFFAGAGVLLTAISSSFWIGGQLLNFLDKREARAKPRATT